MIVTCTEFSVFSCSGQIKAKHQDNFIQGAFLLWKHNINNKCTSVWVCIECSIFNISQTTANSSLKISSDFYGCKFLKKKKKAGKMSNLCVCMCVCTCTRRSTAWWSPHTAAMDELSTWTTTVARNSSFPMLSSPTFTWRTEATLVSFIQNQKKHKRSTFIHIILNHSLPLL